MKKIILILGIFNLVGNTRFSFMINIDQNYILFAKAKQYQILDSIVVSIPACHAGDRGSIPRRGGYYLFDFKKLFI